MKEQCIYKRKQCKPEATQENIIQETQGEKHSPLGKVHEGNTFPNLLA